MPAISAFTPSHDPSYLAEAYASLAAQSLTDWEWVVLANGPKAAAVLAMCASFNDPRIKVWVAPHSISGVGALKREACARCRGDLLFELDHDDWLDPACFNQVVQTARETGADFIYTDNIELYEDGTVQIYDQAYGWEHGQHSYLGQIYPVMLSFPVTPRSLSEIYYAPNHARVWQKEIYWKAGGHDASQYLCDDHDLMCRTFLAGAKFGYIPKVLYYQRRHNGATSLQRWQEIGQLTTQIKNKYLHGMVELWSKQQGLAMLDLGGATGCPRERGYQSVDRQNADILCDVTQGLPVPDCSVGVIRAVDFLEHIPIGQTVPFLNHLYDKLAPQGWLLTETPSTCGPDGRVGRGAYQDPTHCSFWNKNSWWYYTDKSYAKYVIDIRCRFQAVRLGEYYPSEWHEGNGIPYVYADLIKLESGTRQPGLQLI